MAERELYYHKPSVTTIAVTSVPDKMGRGEKLYYVWNVSEKRYLLTAVRKFVVDAMLEDGDWTKIEKKKKKTQNRTSGVVA